MRKLNLNWINSREAYEGYNELSLEQKLFAFYIRKTTLLAPVIGSAAGAVAGPIVAAVLGVAVGDVIGAVVRVVEGAAIGVILGDVIRAVIEIFHPYCVAMGILDPYRILSGSLQDPRGSPVVHIQLG